MFFQKGNILNIAEMKIQNTRRNVVPKREFGENPHKNSRVSFEGFPEKIVLLGKP